MPNTACTMRADNPQAKPPMRRMRFTGLKSGGTIIAKKSCMEGHYHITAPYINYSRPDGKSPPD